jgi:hypothetical protein
MPRPILTAATAIAALSLAACNNNAGRGTAVSGICKPFTTAAAPAAPQPAVPQVATPATNVLPAAPGGDAAAALDDCLHRWGYTLAASSDPANLVAEATVAACGPSLTSWNQSSLATSGQAVEAPSLVSGEPTNPIAEHYAFAGGRALFYVVQARAGHCAPPPASNPPAKS